MNLLTTRPYIIVLLLVFSGTTVSAHQLRGRLFQRRNADRRGDMLDGEYSAGKASIPTGIRVLHDIAYGSDARQRIDVYLPPHPIAAPVIVMVHGGAWRFGDKSAKGVVENKVARWVTEGFIFVSVNYRMLPAADPLTQAEDVARALAAAQGKAKSWGGDPSKFILMGHSAGAHLVALLASSPSLAFKVGARPWLGTVSLDSAALNVVQIMNQRHFRFYDQAFGSDSPYWRSASPIYVLSKEAKPMLMVCSSRRRDSCPQAHDFADKASSIGVRASVLEENLSHMQINQTLGTEGPYTDAVEAFMGSLDPVVRRRLTEGPDGKALSSHKRLGNGLSVSIQNSARGIGLL